MGPSRSHAAEIARNTLEIISAGRYTNYAGETIPLRQTLDDARRGTLAPGWEHDRAIS